MEGAKLSRDELIELIRYGALQNGIDFNDLNQFRINSIINDYCELCYFFKKNYVIGELDTFKRAACFMVAINKGRLCSDKRINATIAVDVSYKMCEKPYWNVGENYDIPKKLEEVDFKEIDKEVYTTSKNMLVDSLIYEGTTPLNYYNILELSYNIALKSKQYKNCIVDRKGIGENNSSNEIEKYRSENEKDIINTDKQKKKSLFRSFFVKKS